MASVGMSTAMDLQGPGLKEPKEWPSNLVDHPGPIHPQFASVNIRLLSFNDWPQALPQSPKKLAEAGFVYLGRGDHVKCFYCDGGLKQWNPSDEPYEEHAFWFQQCGFILTVKGEAFVQEVIKARSAEDDGCETTTSVTDNPPQEQEIVHIKESQTLNGGEEDNSTELDRLRAERLCKICANNNVGVTFEPCGHLATCLHCAPAFVHCPICRRKIERLLRTFYS